MVTSASCAAGPTEQLACMVAQDGTMAGLASGLGLAEATGVGDPVGLAVGDSLARADGDGL